MWRRLFLITMLVTGCSGTPPAVGHSHHHPPTDDPNLAPAGDTGTPALGQPIETMSELEKWVRDVTGECTDLTESGKDELADYLGPTRVTWYGPFVAEWATCRIQPHDKLGLVLFEPGQQRALQEFWLQGLESGEISDNPDWAFGNGFAITAGPLGIDLGLYYLRCEPVEGATGESIPADIEGCVYSK